MSEDHARRYCSERVEGLACHFLGKACNLIGYQHIDDESVRTMMRLGDLKKSISTLNNQAAVRHGELDRETQDRLNLGLSIYEMAGKSAAEQQALIKEAINDYNRRQAEKEYQELQQEVLKTIGIEVSELGSSFRQFIRRVGNLYTRRKSGLRRAIRDDRNDSFQQACQELEELFKNHVERALRIAKEKEK